jgi:predicted nucleic acid-binding protein
MIPACVIDASVAIKWVISEAGTEAAIRLRRSGTKFHAPDHLVPETGNILWKKIQRGELTPAEAQAAIGILRLAKIDIHPTRPQASRAMQFATALRHPVYDASYLALAKALDVPMITADQRLVNKISALRNPAFPSVVHLC